MTLHPLLHRIGALEREVRRRGLDRPADHLRPWLDVLDYVSDDELDALAAAIERGDEAEAARLTAEILERDPLAERRRADDDVQASVDKAQEEARERKARAQSARHHPDEVERPESDEALRSDEKAAAPDADERVAERPPGRGARRDPEPAASAEPEAPPPLPDPGFAWTSAPDSLQWRSARSRRPFDLEDFLDRTF